MANAEILLHVSGPTGRCETPRRNRRGLGRTGWGRLSGERMESVEVFLRRKDAGDDRLIRHTLGKRVAPARLPSGVNVTPEELLVIASQPNQLIFRTIQHGLCDRGRRAAVGQDLTVKQCAAWIGGTPQSIVVDGID